ncbi:MAG: hypothetical protein ACRDZY_02780 [Acidimicrobiales bacterium]
MYAIAVTLAPGVTPKSVGLTGPNITNLGQEGESARVLVDKANHIREGDVLRIVTNASPTETYELNRSAWLACDFIEGADARAFREAKERTEAFAR